MSIRCYLNLHLHMHQPFYKNLRDGSYGMPWVRLHALKNYADIPALHERYPGLRISYNLAPSLIEQILDHAAGAEDYFEIVSRVSAAELSEEQKLFLLSNAFQLNRATQIDPVPRYRQLLSLKGGSDREVDSETAARFSEQDYRDLQVLFNLAWSGWTLRAGPLVKRLIEKGKDYTEKDKNALLDAQRRYLGSVLDPYKRLTENGMAELTVSPYYHPILPLLCDLESAHQATPGLPLPSVEFRHPEDAAEQIRRGLAYAEETLGRRPVGMWPSEGAISARACELMAAEGVRWAATDRTVLANCLGSAPNGEQLYAPYVFKTPSGEIALFFRDTQLSDSLGFIYQTWPPKRAADDFLQRLRAIADPASGAAPVVSVILDGENAWGYYEDNGRPFLEALFGRLQQCDWLETATPAQILANDSVEKNQLDRVVAGSWIYGTLTTWIGHREKNRGWELLAPARAELARAESESSLPVKSLEHARQEMMIAEGSDWFWWYGDDHATAYAREFDSLFRDHVSNVYHFLGLDPPDALLKPIKRVEVDEQIRQPLRLISPDLEGRETRYYEWLNAGHYLAGGAGSMHQTATFLRRMYFGYDLENIYFRFDGAAPLNAQSLQGLVLRIIIAAPVKAAIDFPLGNGEPPRFTGPNDESSALEYGMDQILELALPWRLIGEGDVFAFYVVVLRGEDEIERHPRGRLIEVRRHGEEYDAMNWTV